MVHRTGSSGVTASILRKSVSLKVVTTARHSAVKDYSDMPPVYFFTVLYPGGTLSGSSYQMIFEQPMNRAVSCAVKMKNLVQGSVTVRGNGSAFG